MRLRAAVFTGLSAFALSVTAAEKGDALNDAIESDQKRRPQTQVLAWCASETPDLSVYAEKPVQVDLSN